MATQAVNDLDKKLAEIYSERVTVNIEETKEPQVSKMSPDDFWRSMQVVAINNKALINIIQG